MFKACAGLLIVLNLSIIPQDSTINQGNPMKFNFIALLSAVILLTITTSALYTDVNTRSTNPQPTIQWDNVPIVYYHPNTTNARTPRDVLFTESGGTSNDFGGMGWEQFSLQPPPNSFIVGRRWNGMYWGDNSINFEARFNEGTEITYGYNSTEPVIFSLGIVPSYIVHHDDLYSFNTTFRVPATGNYTFSFAMDLPWEYGARGRTAIVSFRCRVADASGLSYPDNTPVQTRGQDDVVFNYTFPPAINNTVTLTGTLAPSLFPTVKGSVMVLKQEKSMEPIILHLGTPSEFFPTTIEGETKLGNVTLSDLNRAYSRGSQISVTGFPFRLSINGMVYDLFHVNTADILGDYPLYAQQSAVIASGSVNDILSGGRQYFPIKFNIGFYSFSGSNETFTGVIQVFYNCYMKQGATVRLSYNATNPVEFGFYTFSGSPDSPVITPFELGKPSDYIFRESGVQSFERLYKVPRSGFYTFAFKLSGDKDATVVLDASIVK